MPEWPAHLDLLPRDGEGYSAFAGSAFPRWRGQNLARPRLRSGLQGRLARAAARGTLMLMTAFPAFMLAVRERNVLWVLWAMISLWTALDAKTLAVVAFRSRRRRILRGILAVAAGNLALSVWLMFLPLGPPIAAWLR